MKKQFTLLALLAALLVAGAQQAGAQNRVIYTGELGKKVMGYNGPTPVTITITNGKIAKIEAAPNQESPRFFNQAKAHIFPQYIGKTVKQALGLKADISTGATYSSKALIQNIKLGLQTVKSSSKAKGGKAKSSKKRNSKKRR